MVPDFAIEDPIISEIRNILNLSPTDNIIDALVNMMDPLFDSKSSGMIENMTGEDTPKVSSVDSDQKRSGNE